MKRERGGTRREGDSQQRGKIPTEMIPEIEEPWELKRIRQGEGDEEDLYGSDGNEKRRAEKRIVEKRIEENSWVENS